jgi:hypothetical protein
MIIQMFTIVPAVAASESAEVTYELSTTVEAGEKYIIVSNGYALTNKVADVPSANGGVSLASTAITVTDGKITSEVADDMIWDFAEGASELAGPYTTGFFITNGDSKYLSRASSGGTGVAPLNTSTYDATNVASKPHYCYWAFEDINDDGTIKSMFLFSSNSSDYVFFLRGAEAGFDAPGVSQSNMESSLANYPVQLYKVTEVGDPDPIDPPPVTTYELSTTVEAGEKYIIVSNGYSLTNKVADVPTANGGVSLASTLVTVSDGKITSEVTDDMIWDFAEGTSELAGPYTTGFFITNGDSKYLSRASSGGTGVAPLNTSTYDATNVASKPHYCYWAFEDINDDGTIKSMFLFSSDPSDYVFFLRGAEAGFDCPGVSQSNMESSLANYPVQLYKATEASDPGDPGDPGDPVVRHELLFMSDTHSDLTGSVPNFTNLRAILPLLKAENINPEVISFGGDYLYDDMAYLVNWEEVYSILTGVLSTTYPDAEYAFTTGNHDKETNGGISDEEFKRIFGFDRVGVSYVGDEYEIFHIGAQGNTSGVDKELFYEDDIQALDTYLAGKVGSGKVIFIQTHWPLHRAYNWQWRNIENADLMIDTINKYGDNLDIVFLWGHNHYTDTNRHTIKQRGDSILYAEEQYKTINFTYANVGCMNDFYPTQKPYKETTVGPAVCLSVNILNDKLVFTYNRLTDGNTDNPVLTHDANITISGTLYTNPAVVEIPLLNPFGDDEPSDESTVFIEGSQQVKSGEKFTLNVILNNFTEGIYAGDIILKYDDSLFELKTYHETGDLVNIINTKQEQPGSIRVILATEGTAINEGRVPLFTIDFIAKDTAAGESGSFTITKADFGIMPGGLVYSASGTGIDILVEASWEAGDVNKDGVINIGDLAICAYYYMVSEGDPNWSLAKSSDVNNDGIINIIDLSFIAQLVL